MLEPERTLLRAGAEAGLVEDFRSLAEASAPNGEPRYRERPVLEALARFLVRGADGPNRDAAFYELAHLVNAVDACGTSRDRRNAFFLGPEQATPARFQARIDAALKHNGWRRGGFVRGDEGISIRYPDGAFTIRFTRMPFLAALYEFLAGMDDFAFFQELQQFFDEMTIAANGLRAVQAASNRIASAFRQYRRRHFPPIRQDGKFDLIYGFLLERSPAGHVVIDDAAVFAFWAEKSAAGDFRVYRTVFDAFSNFLRAFEEAGRAEALGRAAPIGLDREAGEVEPDDGCDDLDISEWISPLAMLDEGPAAPINFLKKESERKPIEFLMHYGPTATRLPLAFLRLEAFGPVQSAITTDLQIGRGLERVRARVGCEDATPYGGIVAGFEGILGNLKRLQKAAFYALHTNSQSDERTNVVRLHPHDPEILFDQARASVEQDRALPSEDVDQLVIDAAKTFRSIARKGFDEAGLSDDARIEGFRIGATAITRAAGQIERYLAATGRVGRNEQTLDTWFDADRRAFSEKFCILYGVRP